MFFIIGVVIVFGSVLGGYMPHGNPLILWQPLEYLIILGAALGSFIISNPRPVIMGTTKHLSRVLKASPHSKEAYLELLTMMYATFKLINTKGMLALEEHVENPEESTLFEQYPNFLKNHHAREFLCDYLRLMSMGTEDPYIIEDLIDADIETHHKEAHTIAMAVTTMGDGMPAFGIVAAVLGVIVTMSHITEPPEILGGLVGAALVGTFLGILISYGLVGPIGKYLEQYADADTKYFECIKSGLLSHLKGNAPAISVEFARKTLLSYERPDFYELEDATQDVVTP